MPCLSVSLGKWMPILQKANLYCEDDKNGFRFIWASEPRLHISDIMILALTAFNFLSSYVIWPFQIYDCLSTVILCCCRAMSRQRNMYTCWTLLSQQQRGPCAAFLRTTRGRMVLRYQKLYENLWVERPSYLSRSDQPLKPKGRNRRPSFIIIISFDWVLAGK